MTAAELYQFFKSHDRKWLSIRDIQTETGWKSRPLFRMLKKLSDYRFIDRKKIRKPGIRSYNVYRR